MFADYPIVFVSWAYSVKQAAVSYDIGLSPSLDFSSPESLQNRRKERSNSPRKSARFATNKRSSFAVGAISSPGRKHRKSILKKSTAVSLSASTTAKVIPPMETEVIPTSISSGLFPSTSQPNIIPTPFALPPPSPLAMIPRKDKFSSLVSGMAIQETKSNTNETDSQKDLASCFESEDVGQAQGALATPRPFPVAKPFAQRMIHAYSPARPSPLSHVLLMAESTSDSRSGLSQSNSKSDEVNEVIGFRPLGSDPLDLDFNDDNKIGRAHV